MCQAKDKGTPNSCNFLKAYCVNHHKLTKCNGTPKFSEQLLLPTLSRKYIGREPISIHVDHTLRCRLRSPVVLLTRPY